MSRSKDQRGWLLEQVYFFQKAVKFLESRKALLERGIKEMEQQIDGGILAVEQLEKNKVFTQLSPKVERINR